MPDVTPIRPLSRSPDDAIVARLEDLLRLARAGELTSFAATLTMTSSRVGYSYDFGDNPQDLSRLVVGLERLKAKAIALFEEAVEAEDGR
jgi:hypothetical protein